MNQQIERICVSRDDVTQLRELLQTAKGNVSGVTSQYQNLLETEFGTARILPAEQVPDDMVGLGSTVQITDMDTGSTMKVTIVMPDRAGGNDCVSVLSPLGMALFGYGKSHAIEWGPVSRLLRYRIDTVRRSGKRREPTTEKGG